MRRLRPTVRRLQRLLRRRGVGAGLVVTAATAGAIYAYVFRGGPPPGEEGVPAPSGPLVIDLLTAWSMHVIVPGADGNGFPDGADGVALADVDGDGLLDAATGYEQGLRVTLAFNPGPDLVESGAWPFVTLPTTTGCNSEEAQIADIDADGAMDVVTGCEAGTALIEIYFAPSPPNTRAELLVAANWTRVQIPDSIAFQKSMRIVPYDIQGDSSLELVVGGKEAASCGVPPAGEADVAYYASETPRVGSSWAFTSLAPAGWTKQLLIADMNGDTFEDIVYTDGDRIDCPALDQTRRGLRWLESDGLDPPGFTEHQISELSALHQWFSLYDWDGDGDLDILDCASNFLDPGVETTLKWWNNSGAGAFTDTVIPTPTAVGTCIHPNVADLDKDGSADIFVSHAHAINLSGVVWLKRAGAGFAATYERGEVTGILDPDTDVKFDNIYPADVDGDGDLDLVTTEQHIPDGNGPGVGVVYFENPLAPADPGAGGGDGDTPTDGTGDGSGDPLACAALTSGSGTANTSAVTASVTPTADAVVYAAFISSLAAGPAAPSGVTGNGLTWAQEETVSFHADDRRVTVFRAQGAAPSAGAITATWDISQTSFQWVVVECSGADTSGTSGSGATVQSTTNTATAATSITGTLAALAAASSVHLSFSGISINNTQTADADFAELADTNIGTGASGLMVEWATNETVATPTFDTANAGIISLEVRIAP